MRIRIESGFYIFLAVLLLAVPLRWILAAFIAAFVHELGHYLSVRLLGGQVLGGSICFRGAKMETLPMSAGRELIAVLAGPVFSLMLLSLIHILPRVAICGLIQGVYNLLPFYPLDGGRALRCVMALLERRGEWLFFRRHGKFSCKEEKQRVQ